MKMIKWMQFSIAGLIVAVSFQNCGSSDMIFEDVQLSEQKAFFDYPYESSPTFYSDILIMQAEGATDQLLNFSFVGTAAYVPDPSASINYTVDITDPDRDPADNLLCPSASGTLSAGSSAIEPATCTTSRTFSRMKVVLTLTSGSDSTSMEKIYLK